MWENYKSHSELVRDQHPIPVKKAYLTDGSFDLRGVRCRSRVVSLAVCVAARPGLHFDAVGHWCRTTQGRECTARRLARIGSGATFWFLDSIRFVRRVGERGRNLA